VDVLREEAQEDLSVITGTSSEEELGDTVVQITRGRLPWLAMGLMGTMMSAFVVGQFEDAIAKVAILAAFIPVVTAMAGNAAIQSAAITVQGLASGRLLIGDAFRRVGKELLVAMLNGLALAFILLIFLLLFHTVLGIHADFATVIRLAATVSLALLIVIVLATTNGALIPVIMQRFGVDPAVSMGPFVTTANDILGLMVYFLVATMVFM
jgi:magnesium transporter